MQNIRLRFVITGTNGKSSDVRVLPNNIPGLRECLETGLVSINFPQFRNLRQMATYTISIRGGAKSLGHAPKIHPGQQKKMDPDAFNNSHAEAAQTPSPIHQQPPQEQEPADPDAFQ